MLQVYSKKLDRLLHDARGAWCAKFGPPLRIVADSLAVRERIVLRSASRTEWENPLEAAYYGNTEGHAVVEHAEVCLYRLEKIYITGSESLMFSAPHTMLQLDLSLGDFAPRKVRRPIVRLARRMDGLVLPLGGRGTGNRGHFLCEHLPRLLLARDYLGADFPLKILVTPDHVKWQAEYLARLGENPANVFEGTRGTVFCPEVLFVPNLSSTRKADLYAPDVYREIAHRFKAGLVRRPRDRHIFISRKDAPSRRLLNEDEIFSAFRSVYPGLEKVSMSGMTLAEQIALFAETRVVVGAHNQAFRNVLYCEGALTIQLVPGLRSPENEYVAWAANYERLGLIHGNRCLSLYTGYPYRGGDWIFPLADVQRSIDRLYSLPEVTPG